MGGRADGHSLGETLLSTDLPALVTDQTPRDEFSMNPASFRPFLAHARRWSIIDM
jgi:hypothetical protein